MSGMDHMRLFGENRQTKGFRAHLGLAAMLLIWLAGRAGYGQVAGVQIVDVSVGFRGVYKVGLWTPVTVTLQGGKTAVTGHVRAVVPDGDGLPSRVTSAKPYLVAPGETVPVMLYVRFGRIESDLKVEFVDLKSGDVFARRVLDSLRDPEQGGLRWALFSGQELYVSLGGAVGVEDAIRLQHRSSTEAIEHVMLESVEQLPTQWYGYEGVQALVLATSRPEQYRRLTGNSERLAALDDWVQRGGRLVISAAANAAELFQSGPLARFAPGEFVELTSLSQAVDLEAFSEVQEPLPLGRGPKAQLPVARFGKIRGAIRAPENPKADLPLVVVTPHGLGEVVFVSVDLDQAPFVQWKARGNFVAKLLGYPARGREAEPERSVASQAATTGLTDLLGQLRGALDQFEGVKLVPFFVVASLVFGYILLIGPGDYFFVKRVLKRMEWTWITFPVIVLAVSGGAYLLAAQLKGRQLRMNQVDLVDVCLDAPEPFVRGTTWMNVFSPQADTYDLRYAPRPSGQASDEAQVLLAWLGLPGSALGGMDPRTSNPPLSDRPYDFSPDLSRMLNLPIHVWSTKSLTSRWTMPDPGLLTAAVTRGADDTLSGEITSQLNVPLSDCWLAYGRWVYPLGTFKPEETIDLAARWRDREVLLSRLTRNRMEYDEIKKQYNSLSSPFDPTSFDVPLILRQMMFFRASGGQSYVGLLNRYQHFVDLSEHLDLGRGLLIGFTDQPAGQLQRQLGEPWEQIEGPQDKHWTCYRFVIPIGVSSAE